MKVPNLIMMMNRFEILLNCCQQFIVHNNNLTSFLIMTEMLQFYEFFIIQIQVQPLNDSFVALDFRQPSNEAIYDYEAQDDGEVSFRDGDLIINCVKIS